MHPMTLPGPEDRREARERVSSVLFWPSGSSTTRCDGKHVWSNPGDSIATAQLLKLLNN